METADLLERSHPGRRAELKRDILRAALACFNRHGIEATTIDMIRAECDTSVGAIYHHFGNKEGLVAALFLAALEDQAVLRERYMAAAATAREGVHALVHSYVDWVDRQPEWARFQFAARSAVASGPQGGELAARNKARGRQVLQWFAEPARQPALRRLPPELLPSLVIGAAENYSRAWLAGRVPASPAQHRDELAEAAWRAVAAE